MPSSAAEARAPRGYRVVGFLDANIGVGIAARNTLTSLASAGRPVQGVSIRNRNLPDPRPFLAPPHGGPDDVSVLQLSPVEIASYAATWRRYVHPDAPTVCVPFWELPLVPRAWEPVLAAVDAILAPTRFIAAACARCAPPERVLHYPQAVFIPAARPARERWGFSPDAIVFLVAFDLGSDIDRKNPWAAIEAFEAAFPSDDGVRLVIKTKPWPNVATLRAGTRALAARIAGDPASRSWTLTFRTTSSSPCTRAAT